MKRLQQRLVLRHFVVKRKATARVTHRMYATCHAQPLHGNCVTVAHVRLCCHRQVGWQQGVARHKVQHVGLQQFLVLLFMLQPQLYQAVCLRPHGRLGRAYKVQHGGIDVLAVNVDFGQCRARQQTALGARVARSQGFIVGVEEVKVLWIKYLVALLESLQHHRFKKPTGVRQMPLGGAGIWHGLHALVFGRQRLRQRTGTGTHRFEAFRES